MGCTDCLCGCGTSSKLGSYVPFYPSEPGDRRSSLAGSTVSPFQKLADRLPSSERTERPLANPHLLRAAVGTVARQRPLLWCARFCALTRCCSIQPGGSCFPGASNPFAHVGLNATQGSGGFQRSFAKHALNPDVLRCAPIRVNYSCSGTTAVNSSTCASTPVNLRENIRSVDLVRRLTPRLVRRIAALFDTGA
jgi:hypothetical protein